MESEYINAIVVNVLFIVSVLGWGIHGYRTTSKLRQLLNYSSRDKAKVPILIVLETPKTLVIGLLVFDILGQIYLIFFSLLFSKLQIAGHLEDIQNTQIFDSSEVIIFFSEKFISLFLSIIVLLLITQNPTFNYHTKVFISLALSIFSFFMHMARLAHSSHAGILTDGVFVIKAFVIIFLLFVLMYFSTRITDVKSGSKLKFLQEVKNQRLYEEYTENLKNIPDDKLLKEADLILESYNAGFILKNIRRSYRKVILEGRSYLLLALIPIICIMAYIIFSDMKIISSQSEPYLTKKAKHLKNELSIENSLDVSKLGTIDSSQLRPNVILIIASGLSFEMSKKDPFIESMLNGWYSEKAGRIYKLKAEIPTTSYTNWVSMFTGVKTEMHGIFGESLHNNVVPYDSIFNKVQDKAQYIKSSVYGSEFFEKALQNSMKEARTSKNLNQEEISYSPDVLVKHIITYVEKIKKKEKTSQDPINEIEKSLQEATDSSNVSESVSKFSKIIKDKHFLMKIYKDYHFLVYQTNEIDEGTLKSGYSESSQKYTDKLTRRVKQIIDDSTENSVIMLTSERGNLMSSGGYSGNERESIEVPLLVYRRGSKLGQDMAIEEANIVDMAPTLSALLGVGVPDENQGKFITDIVDDVLQTREERTATYKNLLVQRLNMLKFLTHSDEKELSKKIETMDSEKDYQVLISEIDEKYSSFIQSLKEEKSLRLFLINFFCLLSLLLLLVFIIEAFTPVDFLSLFTFKSSISRRENVSSFFTALVITFIFYLIAVTYSIIYFLGIKRYKSWTPAFLSYPLRYPEYLLSFILIPTLLGVIFMRLPFWMYASWEESENTVRNSEQETINTDDSVIINPYEEKTNTVKLNFSRLFLPVQTYRFKTSSMAKVYLLRMYFLLINITIGIAILTFLSEFRGIYFDFSQKPNSMIFYKKWNGRFILISFGLISLILCIFSMYSFFLWPPFSIERRNYDSLYLLGEYKSYRKTGVQSNEMRILTSQTSKIMDLMSVPIRERFENGLIDRTANLEDRLRGEETVNLLQNRNISLD